MAWIIFVARLPTSGGLLAGAALCLYGPGLDGFAAAGEAALDGAGWRGG
jgi:hypothetical protein